jgi:multidrug efflux pump subunit AcrA (membrane-fusion protein)
MIKLNIRTFGFYRRLLVTLFGMGLFLSILGASGFAWGCTSKSGPASGQWRQAVTPDGNAFMLKREKGVINQAPTDGSVRPWLILASRGMRHEGMRYDYDEHEHGESVAPTFSRIVQSQRFIPVLILIGLLAIILLAYRLWWYKPLLPVIVVARREIQGVVKSLGTVQSQEPMTVRSQRSGTIEKLHVAQGDKVARGQVLAEMRPSTLKDEAKAAPEDLVQLVASMGGVITNCVLAAGDEVYPGTPIFQIVEADQIRIAAKISEPRGSQTRAGQAVVIKLSSGRECDGEVMMVRKDPDPDNPQYEVLVKFNDVPDPVVIVEEAAIIIATGRQTAPAVPITAITSRNDQSGVLVVEDGLVHFRPISLGVQNDKWAAALAGVKEGEQVIISPEAGKPGKEVRAEVVGAAFLEE